jgi:RNA polymerase sigma factor (sigma-70 family)
MPARSEVSNSDAGLARECRQGNAEAWRRLVEQLTPMVFRLSFHLLRNRAEAEDASQEVFLRVHRSFDSYDETRPLAPWVARITYNICLRRLGGLGRKSTQPIDPGRLDEVLDSRAPDPEAEAARRQAERHLGAAFSDLSAQDRALLTLRYRDGLSDAEVAEATGMPVNTVKTRIFRAKGRMRTCLAPLLQDGKP